MKHNSCKFWNGQHGILAGREYLIFCKHENVRGWVSASKCNKCGLFDIK